MYNKILVPLDGSATAECVLPLVRSLASALSLPAELMGVVETVGMGPSMDENKLWYLNKFIEDARQARELYLHDASLKLGSNGVTVTVTAGLPAEAILEKGSAEPNTLIAIATHGRSGINRWLLGSVAEKLLIATQNPLLVVRAPRQSAHTGVLKSLIVPLDGSGLAEKILPHVLFLANHLELDVHMVRVFGLPTDAYLVGDGMIVTGPGEIREAKRQESQTYLDSKTQELRAAGLARISATAVEGDAASEIIDLANSTADALVAMSTRGRSGIGRWVLGSVTEKVIRYGKSPVLVIRPE